MPPGPELPACRGCTRRCGSRRALTWGIGIVLASILSYPTRCQISSGTESLQEAERKAMLAWKQSLTTYSRQSSLNTWSADSIVCEAWEGVDCWNGRVTRIELPGQGIEGTLPQQFSVLAGLEQLSLKFNRLHGVVIPGSWTSLEALKMIDLANNELEGSLPGNLDTIGRLHTLQLQNNRIAGSLPKHLGSLEYLSLGSNHIVGKLPSSWGTVTSLKSLKLENNQLTGELPTSWSALQGLMYLELQDNQLSGSLPIEWTSMSSIKFMELFNNLLDSRQLETIEADMATSDWVLLPQRESQGHRQPPTEIDQATVEGSAGGSNGAAPNPEEMERLFSPAVPGISPKVVYRGLSPPRLLAIVFGITAGITTIVIGMLVYFTVCRVHRSLKDTKELLMTNLANEKPSDDIDFWHQGELHVKQDSYDGGLVYQESTTSGSPMSDHSAFGVIKRNSPRATEGDMALKVSHVCTGRGNDNPVLLDTNWGSISSHIPVLPQPFAQPDGIGGANDLIFGTNSWLRR